MPIYTVEGPDGRRYKIEGPEGATAEQLAAVINPPSMLDRAADTWNNYQVGGAEVAAALGSAMIAEPIAGLAGIVQGLNPWAEQGASARAVEATRNAMTYSPRTDAGRAGLERVAGVLEPVGRAFEKAEGYLGDAAYNKTGSPALAAAAATIPTAALELLGAAVGKALTKTKRATPENVRRELQRIGVDADRLPDADVRRIVDNLNRGGDFSGDALVGSLDEAPAATRDWVPTTRAEQRGIETNDFSLWRKQNEAAAGKYGDEAERAVNDFTDMRERQLGKVVQDQVDSLGPTQGGGSSAALSNDLYQGILSKVEDAKKAKSDAYKNVDRIAEEHGPMMANPEVMGEALGAAYQGFNGKVKLASQAETPLAFDLYKEIQAAMRGDKPNDLPGALSPPDNAMTSLDNFESIRRRIGAAERAADPGSADELLLGQVRRQFDEWLDNAVDNGKFFGNPEQLAALKEARKLNREYMQIIKGTHKDGKPTARTRIINDVVNGRSNPEKVMEQILGSTGTKQGSMIVNDFKRLFGEDSPEFGALRQAAFWNIFGKAISVADDGTLRLSKGNYINTLSSQLKGKESNLRALFSEDEVHRWTTFAGKLKKLQEDVRKKNFSGTAYHLSDTLKGLANKLDLFTARIASNAVEGTSHAWNWRKLRKHGLTEGDFTVTSDVGALIGALAAGGQKEAGKPALLLAEDDDKQPQNIGVLAEAQ